MVFERSLDANDYARGFEDGAGVAAFDESEFCCAAVGDDRRQHVATADFKIDLAVDWPIDHLGDGAAEDVSGAHFRVVQVGAEDDCARLDDSAGRHALFQPEPLNGTDGDGRDDFSPTGQADGNLGIDRALDDR